MDLILTATPWDQTLPSKNGAANTLIYLRSHREKMDGQALDSASLPATSVLGATSAAALEGHSVKWGWRMLVYTNQQRVLVLTNCKVTVFVPSASHHSGPKYGDWSVWRFWSQGKHLACGLHFEHIDDCRGHGIIYILTTCTCIFNYSLMS